MKPYIYIRHIPSRAQNFDQIFKGGKVHRRFIHRKLSYKLISLMAGSLFHPEIFLKDLNFSENLRRNKRKNNLAN